MSHIVWKKSQRITFFPEKSEYLKHIFVLPNKTKNAIPSFKEISLQTELSCPTRFIVQGGWGELDGLSPEILVSHIGWAGEYEKKFVEHSRRYGSICRPTFSSCGGLWPLALTFFCPLGP